MAVSANGTHITTIVLLAGNPILIKVIINIRLFFVISILIYFLFLIFILIIFLRWQGERRWIHFIFNIFLLILILLCFLFLSFLNRRIKNGLLGSNIFLSFLVNRLYQIFPWLIKLFLFYIIIKCHFYSFLVSLILFNELAWWIKFNFYPYFIFFKIGLDIFLLLLIATICDFLFNWMIINISFQNFWSETNKIWIIIFQKYISKIYELKITMVYTSINYISPSLFPDI